MLRAIRTLPFWVQFLAAIALGIILGLFISSFYFIDDLCHTAESGAQICDSHILPLVIVWKFWKFLNDASAVITAIATGVIAWFTTTIWKIAKKELRHNREVERGYVAGGGIRQLATVLYAAQPTPAQIPPNGQSFQQQDGRFVVVAPNGQFEVHINNHGKTTARTHHFQWGFCDASLRPPLPIPYGPLVPLRDDIGPGTQSRPVRAVPIQPQPSGRTAVFGRFHWDDIWGNHWSSGFIYEIPDGPVTNNGSLSIEAPSEYWADIDENRRQYP